MLEKTLKFTSQDGGKNGFNIYYKAYPNETVSISGGEEISNWTPHGNGIK